MRTGEIKIAWKEYEQYGIKYIGIMVGGMEVTICTINERRDVDAALGLANKPAMRQKARAAISDIEALLQVMT